MRAAKIIPFVKEPVSSLPRQMLIMRDDWGRVSGPGSYRNTVGNEGGHNCLTLLGRPASSEKNLFFTNSSSLEHKNG